MTAVAAESQKLRWFLLGLALLVVVVAGGLPLVVQSPGGVRAPGALPTVNAALNAASALLLTAGYLFVRRGRLGAHRACMVSAVVTSTLFLVTYTLHHLQAGSVRFVGPPALRVVYLAFLVPHILLAVPVVPLALFTLLRGLRDRREAHKRLARWTLPLWLFVSVSGVVVYFMLYRL